MNSYCLFICENYMLLETSATSAYKRGDVAEKNRTLDTEIRQIETTAPDAPFFVSVF